MRVLARIKVVATMISEVYDAFIAAGAPEDKAGRAAEAIAIGSIALNQSC
jgi:hypothetical protein